VLTPGEHAHSVGAGADLGPGSGHERVDAAELARATWRKSSWSAHNGNCVEVAVLGGRLIGVRDTKDAGRGPVLCFADAAWRSFIEDMKNGE
jgi:uncharacterized protein DUF397